ncbi:hypothetical protein ACLKA6_008039 [Drosophila palustris]
MIQILFLILLLGAATSQALPANITVGTGPKIPMLPPVQPNQPTLNPEDIATFTTMFLNLFKGIADWRNLVAADTVQSVWQSPPMIDISHRLFGT